MTCPPEKLTSCSVRRRDCGLVLAALILGGAPASAAPFGAATPIPGFGASPVLAGLVERRGWPDRLVVALEQSLFDGVERGIYATQADISPATASSDLRRLLDAGLLVQHGRARSTRYVASDDLRTRVAAELSAHAG